MKKNPNMNKVIFSVLLTAFLFSTMEVVLKLGGGGMDSLQLTFLRFLIGGLVLLPFGLREKTLGTLGKSDFLWVLLVGIVGIPISMLAFQLGVERCNAATAAAIMSMNPLITMILLHIFTENKMTNRKWLAFVLGIVAAIFLIKPWNIQTGNTALGMFLMLVAASTFSIYTILGKRSIEKVGTFTQISLSFIMGSLVLLVIMILMQRPVLAGVSHHLPLVLYIGIFVTGIGYLSLNVAIKLSDAAAGSIAFFIKPAMAPVFAVLILHETILWNTVVGVILLITASVLTLTGRAGGQESAAPKGKGQRPNK